MEDCFGEAGIEDDLFEFPAILQLVKLFIVKIAQVGVIRTKSDGRYHCDIIAFGILQRNERIGSFNPFYVWI